MISAPRAHRTSRGETHAARGPGEGPALTRSGQRHIDAPCLPKFNRAALEPIPAVWFTKASSRNHKDTSVVDKQLQTIELQSEVSMLDQIRNHWFRLGGMLMGAALTLSTLVLPLHPAKAQCLGVDLGLVCAGLGLPSAFSHPN